MGIPATAIFANPGQTVRLTIQTVDGYGDRADGYVPIVQQVLFPDLSIAQGYPQSMARVGKGLYIHGLVIPTGVAFLGTFIASVYYEEAGGKRWETFTIQVARPFGNTTVSPL